MAERNQQSRNCLIPPLRLKQLDITDLDPYLVFLPLSTPISLVEKCMRIHKLPWSIWKSCNHEIIFLDKSRNHLSDKDKTFREYEVEQFDDIFFLPIRKSIPRPFGLEGAKTDALAGKQFLLAISRTGITEKTWLTVRPEHNIAFVQAQIELLMHVSIADQRLIWKGKQLLQTAILQDLGLNNGCVLYLVHSRQVSHGPCICWYLNEYLQKGDNLSSILTIEMLRDPAVLQVLQQGPPPAYEAPNG